MFTQTDPMPYGAGAAFESAYVYRFNNPFAYVDPSGLRATQACQPPGLATQWKIRFEALVPGSRFEGCERLQAVAVFSIDSSVVVPVASTVAVASAGFAGAGAAAPLAGTIALPAVGVPSLVFANGSVGVGVAIVGGGAIAVSPGSAGVVVGVGAVLATGSGKGWPRNTSRSNKFQNRVFDEAIRRAEAQTGKTFGKDIRRRVHDAISGQDYNGDEIVDIAVGLLS